MLFTLLFNSFYLSVLLQLTRSLLQISFLCPKCTCSWGGGDRRLWTHRGAPAGVGLRGTTGRRKGTGAPAGSQGAQGPAEGWPHRRVVSPLVSMSVETILSHVASETCRAAGAPPPPPPGPAWLVNATLSASLTLFSSVLSKYHPEQGRSASELPTSLSPRTAHPHRAEDQGLKQKSHTTTKATAWPGVTLGLLSPFV